MKRLICIVALLAMVIFSGSAIASTYIIGQDLYDNNFYDIRTYDESHPSYGMQSHVGGWQVGISAFSPELQADISRVEIVGTGGGNSEYTTIITKPDAYDWMGTHFNDYVIFMGTAFLVCDQYDIRAYDNAGELITFIFNGDPNQTVHDVITIIPGKGNIAPSISKIKNMALKKNGEIRMRFTAPDHPDANHIRIRLFDEDGNGIYEEKILPPFEIVQKDGDVIVDMVKTFIPEEYAGHTGRIEYRTKGADPYGGEGSYTLRGITYFQLPAPEEPEVPLARCFTFNGTIYNRVNNMGPAWDGSTLFAQNGLNIDTPVSYQICTNEDGGFTAELRAFPAVGGTALSDIGNPTEMPFNTGDYTAGWLLVGTPGEYVQVVFGETFPQAWAIGDTYEVIHSIHQPHADPNSPWGPDWYSRIRSMGTIISIDPVVE